MTLSSLGDYFLPFRPHYRAAPGEKPSSASGGTVLDAAGAACNDTTAPAAPARCRTESWHAFVCLFKTNAHVGGPSRANFSRFFPRSLVDRIATAYSRVGRRADGISLICQCSLCGCVFPSIQRLCAHVIGDDVALIERFQGGLNVSHRELLLHEPGVDDHGEDTKGDGPHGVAQAKDHRRDCV